MKFVLAIIGIIALLFSMSIISSQSDVNQRYERYYHEDGWWLDEHGNYLIYEEQNGIYRFRAVESIDQ